MTTPIRDAATIILVRDAPTGDAGVEVCMLRRTLTAEFVAGAYVFPGGALEPGDRGPEAEAICHGRTDAEASAVLGVDSGGLAFWVAALRECFEEAGLLLAYGNGDAAGPEAEATLLDLTDRSTAARFQRHRDALNAGTTSLVDVCRAEGLALAVDSLYFVSHWVTPELAPKRYDTRFFLAVAPSGQVARHDDGETIASLWVRPGEAIARHEAGELSLLHPTVVNLTNLAGFRSTGEVVAWASGITHVVKMLPIVVIEDDRVLVLRPGDSGYEEALADKRASEAAEAGPG